MSRLEKTVDDAIQIYGKPYQTAVTLYSLARHSERWISTLFVSLDRRQPEHFDFRALLKDLPFRVRWHRPRFWLGSTTIQPSWKLRIPPYRRSIRYQFAWEETHQPFLFVTHSDMLYRGDLTEHILTRSVMPQQSGALDNAGIARQITREFVRQTAIGSIAHTRTIHSIARHHPFWPTPQSLSRHEWTCPRLASSRVPLNEFAALINMDVARPLSYPKGPVLPFGRMFGLDLGAHWFRQMCTLGRDIRHFNFTPLASHGWAMDGYGGDVSTNDPELYRRTEQMALEVLRSEYGWSK